LPESPVTAAIHRVQQRWRVRSIALTIAGAGAAFAAVTVVGSVAFAVGIAVVAVAVMWLRSPALSSVDAARLIESRYGALDNLVVTAAELHVRPREIRPEIRDAIDQQSAERIRSVNANRVVPIASPVAVAMAVVVGCGLIVRAGGDSITQRPGTVAASQTSQRGAPVLVVTVTPPAYTRLETEVLEDPLQAAAIAGSRVQVASGGATLRDFVATESAAFEFRIGEELRFLSLLVRPDAPPLLRVVTPGKDTAFAEPKGQVPIAIESRDDLGLASLALRYTKASGGGENVAFSEGEIPLRITRAGNQHWEAQASLALDALNLADGDILVYRAIARDSNPDGAPVQSDQYLIEIGRNAEIADAGFALPTEEKKYAISQQMVIYKTEQLIAGAAKMTAEARLEQSRNIGMEQRMVRAEVVFLGGGEIQDEVEEAAHSHELAEGRLENTGRAEMLLAINVMSRAEAQLNDGRLKEALVLERQALAHLERALDRRRFFLRTLPDRSRIDAARRLTGERKDARSWNRDQAPASGDRFDRLRGVMGDLAAAAVKPAAADAALAARVAALDPSSTDLQGAAVAIAAAPTDPARLAAVQAAMKAVTGHALRQFAGAAPIDVGANPLSGALADELSRRPRQ
jgi:hypothetical protein